MSAVEIAAQPTTVIRPPASPGGMNVDWEERVNTDRLRTYGAALRQLDLQDRQQSDGRWINNRAENSHLPLRRRERAMLRFRRMRSLQKFAAVHSSVYNHFNLERSLSSRSTFRTNRAAALEEWRGLYAG